MSLHTVVVIGASFGGLPVAHALLKDVLPASGKDYKLVLINPSEEFYWKIGAPRAVTRPDKLSLEQSLLNFVPTFEKYGDKFQFIKGKVTALEPNSKVVEVNTGDKISYDQVVIASGTYFDNDIWSTSRGTEALRNEVHDLHSKLPSAQTIMIAGGGPCGVETAGELGEAYGGKKEITLLSGSDRLLNRLQNRKPSQLSQQMLEKMGITVTHNVQVKSATKEGDKTLVTLSNGETKTVDVYIGAVGDKPNSSFVPKEWLTERGQIKTDTNTLRVDVPGVTGVYCVGSVASYSDGSILDTKLAYTAAVESVRLDINGTSKSLNIVIAEHDTNNATDGGARTNKVYKKIQAEMAFVPVGSQQGVGLAFGWKLPSFVIKMAKAKDYMIGNAPKLIQGQA